VVLALARAGAGSLVIANRTEDRARRLAELSQRNGVAATAVPLSEADDAAGAADLIVNCTTVGMSHGPDEAGSPLSAGCISASCLVNDLVYNPLETPLLRDAARAGAAVLGGIQMLVYQGAASFEMWTGQLAPVPVMLDAAAAEMESRSLNSG
jgi:shikimate dehydrogenase